MYDIKNEDLAEAGAMAGMLGGIAMAIVMMIQSSVAGLGFWMPLQTMSAPFFGVEAILGGFWPGFVGAIIHLIVSACFGALFGAFLRPTARLKAYFWPAIACSAVLWAISTFALLPWVNRVMSDRMALAPGWWFVSYLVFGAIVGNTPYFQAKKDTIERGHGMSEGESMQGRAA